MNHSVQIKNEFVEIGRSDSGWAVLYLDRSDGSYWEINYPDSTQHGGGEPSMKRLSRDEVTEKFKINV